jgi:hypothetical protein
MAPTLLLMARSSAMRLLWQEHTLTAVSALYPVNTALAHPFAYALTTRRGEEPDPACIRCHAPHLTSGCARPDPSSVRCPSA